MNHKIIHFYLVTVEDLTFEADFKIQAQRSEGVHAFVTHWTCEFTHCHTRTGFDTSPAAPYTHWKVRPGRHPVRPTPPDFSNRTHSHNRM